MNEDEVVGLRFDADERVDLLMLWCVSYSPAKGRMDNGPKI